MKNLFRFTSIISIFIVALFILAGCNGDGERITSCVEDNETAITKGTCVMNIALEKDTESEALEICDQIQNGVQNTCIRNIAVKFENKELCFDNENEIETYICLANLAEKQMDPVICTEIARKKDEEFCYRKVAITTLNESNCERITDNESFKATCIESVEYARTFHEKNKEAADLDLEIQEAETTETTE